MMFWEAPRPSLHSLPEGPSTVFCVAVIAWTVLWRWGSRRRRSDLFLLTSQLDYTPQNSDLSCLPGSSVSLKTNRDVSEVAVARRCEILMNRITMRPSTMPKLSLMTLARGARQLVVQEALLRGRDEESVVIHTNYNKALRDTEHISSVRMFEICFIQTDSWHDSNRQSWFRVI